MEATLEILTRLESKMSLLGKNLSGKKVVVGFDGFIDSIRKIVHHRDALGVHYYKSLTEFSDKVRNAAGRSGQVEIDVQRIKLGGNAPILSLALGHLGAPTTCLGSTDSEIFSPLAERCQVISLMSPGESEALEFDDGKLILSNLKAFEEYDWSYIKKKVGLERLRTVISKCDLIAMVDWANLVHAEDIWDGIINDILIPSGRRNYMIFFDLCDPSRKSAGEIDDILDVISRFSYCGTVTLGLNENELLTIWSALSGRTDRVSVEEAGKFLHGALNIDCLLIHLVDHSVVFHQREVFDLKGRLVTDPKIQTGGGDNLNAGFILGMLNGFSITEAVTLGMAASGWYVQEGKSAGLADLQEYIRVWKQELISAMAQQSVKEITTAN